MRRDKAQNVWTVGEWTFFEVVDHGFTGDLRGKPLYTFEREGEKPSNEYWGSLEHAMAAAIAEKWMGRKGAMGTAVGSADDWFMRMIGAEVS